MDKKVPSTTLKKFQTVHSRWSLSSKWQTKLTKHHPPQTSTGARRMRTAGKILWIISRSRASINPPRAHLTKNQHQAKRNRLSPRSRTLQASKIYQVLVKNSKLTMITISAALMTSTIINLITKMNRVSTRMLNVSSTTSKTNKRRVLKLKLNVQIRTRNRRQLQVERKEMLASLIRILIRLMWRKT